VQKIICTFGFCIRCCRLEAMCPGSFQAGCRVQYACVGVISHPCRWLPGLGALCCYPEGCECSLWSQQRIPESPVRYHHMSPSLHYGGPSAQHRQRERPQTYLSKTSDIQKSMVPSKRTALSWRAPPAPRRSDISKVRIASEGHDICTPCLTITEGQLA
jgi:hypothetical protein